jgi:hypothetical protein
VGLQGGLQGLTAHGWVVLATKTPVVSLLLMGFSVLGLNIIPILVSIRYSGYFCQACSCLRLRGSLAYVPKIIKRGAARLLVAKPHTRVIGYTSTLTSSKSRRVKL